MKKILSLILALIMMLSCATMIFAEDTVLSDETPVEVDETASAYYEAVQFLVAYDIMHGKGETLGVYDDIQRYEMALFMARILTGWVEDSTWEDGTLNSSEFTDLAGTAADKYYGAISYVNQKGVIEGYGNGKFGPTDGITYQDALTMAVRALGYNGLAYPWGYIETAISLGLDDGITGVTFTDTLKREVVAQIIYNTLFATNKAGTTLAESVFDLSLAWTNIIITKTDAATDDVPAGYVAFSIFNDDGTIDGETYYVEAAQLGLDGVHDDEKAWGTVYKVMFDTEAEFGLNTVIAYESLELETIANTGRLETVVGGYPIQAFLADFDIVTVYTEKNYLNTTPEIIIADGTGALKEFTAENYYAVDWATGNIVYVNKGEVQKLWYCKKDGNVSVFNPVIALDGGSKDTQFGLYAQKGEGWVICDADGKTACPECGYQYWEHSINSQQYCGWMNFVDAGTDYLAPVEKVLWYWHSELKTYFQITVNWVKGADGKVTADYGMKMMTAAERAELETLLNTYNKYTYESLNYLNYYDFDAATAYASLRVFDTTGDDVADYGLFEEYRFGIIYNTTIKCENCLGSGKHQYVAGYEVIDISNTPVGTTSNALPPVKAEGVCAHGTAWISDGSEVVDGSYVIYGYNPVTGEIKIVKTISATIEEDEDNYVGYGYIRAYNVGNNTITIVDANGESFKVNYNYSALPGTISDAMLTTHNGEDGTVGAGFPAIANRYLNGFFNQYVEYVMVDDRLVYLELEGASDNYIVVEKYAGIHEDGSIVVWGYEVGAKSNVTELKQFRINSFNGWAKGDWYNYSWLYEAEIEVAFTRGSVYAIKSYDPTAEGYNVELLSTLVKDDEGNTSLDDYNYFATGTKTTLTYVNANVGGMSESGSTTAGGTVGRKMAASDKYVFIYDIDDKAGYNAIPIVTYEGIVTNTAAAVRGYRIGSTAGTYIFYIDGDDCYVKGFAGAAEQGYGLVMFLEWGSNSAYDEYTGKDYLVGSTVRTAYVLDLYTSRMKEITVYPGSYKAAKIEGESGSLKDGYGDQVAASFIWFDSMTGCVYQTVNGVLVDDTPVDPALIPGIFAETVTGTNIITDSLVLETGKVIAKLNGVPMDWNHSIDFGYDGEQQGDYEGFAGIEINRRMTLKALGAAFHELAPYALGRKQGASVIVNAIKPNTDGTATIKHIASQTGDNWLGAQSNKNYGNRSMSSVVSFFGDSSNINQAYNYSLIYHSDINGSASADNKNSNSKAVVYLYDAMGNEEVDAVLKNYYPGKSNVDGFTSPNEYKEAPVVIAGVTDSKTEITAVDNVVMYAKLDDVNTVAGKNGGGYYLGNDEDLLLLNEARNKFRDGIWSIGFWFKTDKIESDPVIMGTQDWNDGVSNGFGLYLDGADLYLNLGDGDGDHRSKIFAKGVLTAGQWYYITLVVDAKTTHAAQIYVDGVLKGEGKIHEGFDYDNLRGDYNFAIGWDGDWNYEQKVDGVIDEILVVDDLLTAAEVAALAGVTEE